MSGAKAKDVSSEDGSSEDESGHASKKRKHQDSNDKKDKKSVKDDEPNSMKKDKDGSSYFAVCIRVFVKN